MNGQEIINQAIGIIKRQDVTGDNRTTLLFFVNTARRAVLRDRKIPRLFQYVTNVPHSSGVIDMTDRKIKSPRTVEWQYTEGGTVKRVQLAETYSYKEAIDIYGDLTTTGSPTGFLRLGTSLYILPVLTTGQINIYGEFWPEEIADSAASSDVLTAEVPEAWVYLGAAEYLDMLGEKEKAAYWRQKGDAIVERYIEQFANQAFDTADAWRRGPFGRPLTGRRPATTSDLERGKW